MAEEHERRDVARRSTARRPQDSRPSGEQREDQARQDAKSRQNAEHREIGSAVRNWPRSSVSKSCACTSTPGIRPLAVWRGDAIIGCGNGRDPDEHDLVRGSARPAPVCPPVPSARSWNRLARDRVCAGPIPVLGARGGNQLVADLEIVGRLHNALAARQPESLQRQCPMAFRARCALRAESVRVTPSRGSLIGLIVSERSRQRARNRAADSPSGHSQDARPAPDSWSRCMARARALRLRQDLSCRREPCRSPPPWDAPARSARSALASMLRYSRTPPIALYVASSIARMMQLRGGGRRADASGTSSRRRNRRFAWPAGPAGDDRDRQAGGQNADVAERALTWPRPFQSRPAPSAARR